jgi:ABC-2 type transport system permease protein
VGSVVSVRVAGGTWRDDARAVFVVWKRELIRFGRSRLRIITGLAQPVIYLFVLGTGLSSIVPSSTGSDFNYRTFMFPGVLAMTILFTSIFSAVSIVWDREFGFLREMLVAPVRRSALVTGKCLGGASVATAQGALMLVFAGLVGVPYSPALIVALLLLMALTAFVLNALGIVIASRMQQVESFQIVMQFVVLPMFFLSGALFPLNQLPHWLSVLTRLDPLTYLVQPMRHVVFDHVDVPPRAEAALAPDVTWFGWSVPVALMVLLSIALGLALLGVAVYQFSKAD